MFEKKSQEENNNDFETIVGSSIKIQGDFTGKGNIKIGGIIEGSVTTDNDIQVENGAKITANIVANNARIAGEVTGNISVASRIDLLSTSKIEGDIEAEVINIEAGALFNGKSTMKKMNPKNNSASAKSNS